MPTLDLPTEIWLEILSYLPKGASRKLLGVNRVFFELALQNIYEELRLISGDRETMKSLSQLRYGTTASCTMQQLVEQFFYPSYPNIAKRVRCIYIRPASLPKPSDEQEVTRNDRFWSKSRKAKRMSGKPKATNNSSEHPPYSICSLDTFLRAAMEATRACTNLEELTIVLHDQIATPAFVTFVKALWSGDSIGRCFRRLSISTTVAKIPLLLGSLIKPTKNLPNFRELVLDISLSQSAHTDFDWISATQRVGSFTRIYKDTITSLSIFSMAFKDTLGKLFTELPYFPALKKFELLAVLNPQTFANRELITNFIASHASTLETLIISPRPPSSSLNVSTYNLYRQWLVSEDPRTSPHEALFSSLVLPKLHTFQVCVTKTDYQFDTYFPVQADLSYPPLLPQLFRITPTLTKLIMTEEDNIKHDELSQIIDLLPTREGTVLLEELSFACNTLSCTTLDMLAKRLPRLTSLTITFGVTASNSEYYDPWSGHIAVQEFALVMRTRSYHAWPVRYLRLMKRSSCREGHPSEETMRVVASCISPNVLLDTAWTCTCTVMDSRDEAFHWP
ncbi:hypothetical protein D9613_009249 [Agrocybe pediades]|uniref:F-box domain-containing protein n=1 Tax=Agrocybe pediades TaxID=84607 RepID=A0A8H4VTU8_9AGAR|nr:hypothetical protein D9613_009249 [Agrocybe pediades]